MFFLVSILFIVFFSCSPKNEDFTNTYQIPKKTSLIQVENAISTF